MMIVITDGESHDSPDLEKVIRQSEKDNVTRYAVAVSPTLGGGECSWPLSEALPSNPQGFPGAASLAKLCPPLKNKWSVREALGSIPSSVYNQTWWCTPAIPALGKQGRKGRNSRSSLAVGQVLIQLSGATFVSKFTLDVLCVLHRPV